MDKAELDKAMAAGPGLSPEVVERIITTGGLPIDPAQAADLVRAANTPLPSPMAQVIVQSQTKEQFEAAIAKATVSIPTQPVGRKIAVLGFTDSWKQAPFNDPTWEIWGLNELYMFIPRWTAWFELHSRAVYEADKTRVSDHIQRLKAMTCPVLMHQHYDDIPMSRPYPLDVIRQAFPNPAGGLPYLTNSIAFMLALAILEGAQELGVYGVDMAHDTEYQQQRPSCEYFIGIAQGRGIKVHLPPDCELLKTDFLYGYDQENLERWNVRMLAREKDLENKLAAMDNQIAQGMEARAQYRGALQDVQHLRKNWKGIVSTTSG